MASNVTEPENVLGDSNFVYAAVALAVIAIVLLVVFGIFLWCLWHRLVSLRLQLTVAEGDLRSLEEANRCRPSSGGAFSDISQPGPEIHRTVSGSPSEKSEKTTVQLWGRRATIVGSPKILSQVYSITQDYFSPKDLVKREKKILIPTARLNIKSKYFTDELPEGHLSEGPVPSQSQRPTSIIDLPRGTLDGEAIEMIPKPYLGNKEIFQHKTIDESGGTIEISGVRLKVPEGALDEPVNLSIGVSWDTEKYPRLEGRQAMLSPVVICEPHGLVFKHPVELSFPHCAEKIMEDWAPKLLFSQQRIDSPPEWKPLTMEDYTERKYETAKVTMKIKHFTLFTMAGESKSGKVAAKAVKILAFAPLLKVGKMHKVRIYCVENYDREIEEILDDEKKLEGRRALPRRPLLIYDNNKNLCLEKRQVSEGWKLDGEPIQELNFEEVWHGLTPNQEFAFEVLKNVAKFSCQISAYQKENETYSQKLNINQQAEPDAEMPGLIPRKLRQKLVELLQPETATGHNWRALAATMGLTGEDVTFIESQKSPVDALLDKWEEENQDLKTLHEMMLTIERLDAVSEIEEYYKPTNYDR